ncbi:hypothetical protein INR49_030608 [Caranx melampygus]|nr:hypothetical protein INR49_030608 [Caranx melampygus]
MSQHRRKQGVEDYAQRRPRLHNEKGREREGGQLHAPPRHSLNSFTGSHGVEAGESCSDLLHHLRLIGKEPLQNSRSYKNLLDLLASSQGGHFILTLIHHVVRPVQSQHDGVVSRSVEAGKRSSDLLHHLRLLWEEPLQDSRSCENLLDLLGSSQVSADVWTLHGLRALHQKTSVPKPRNNG